MTVTNNKRNKIIIGFLWSIFFLLGGAKSCTSTPASSPTQKAGNNEQDEELKVLEENLALIKEAYEQVDRAGNYGRGSERNLAIALYNPKGPGKPKIVIAISGNESDVREGKYISPDTEKNRKILEDMIPSLKKPYDIEKLDLIDTSSEDRIIYDNDDQNGPIGKLTADGLVTFYQNDSKPDKKEDRNLRHLDAEVILIRHLLRHASLESNIYLFSARNICGRDGFLQPESGLYKRNNYSQYEIRNKGKTQNANLLSAKICSTDGFEKTLTPNYIKKGVLGQFASMMSGNREKLAKLYAVEFKPNLSNGRVYRISQTGEKEILKGNTWQLLNSKK